MADEQREGLVHAIVYPTNTKPTGACRPVATQMHCDGKRNSHKSVGAIARGRPTDHRAWDGRGTSTQLGAHREARRSRSDPVRSCVRRPLGVVASFTPWNGANVLSWRAVVSPVAAGNTVVVKPSEFAPVSAGIMLAEVAEEAGFSAGVINVVTHAPEAAGAIADEFFDRPEVRVINLIGGIRTARMLAERAGRLLKRT